MKRSCKPGLGPAQVALARKLIANGLNPRIVAAAFGVNRFVLLRAMRRRA